MEICYAAYRTTTVELNTEATGTLINSVNEEKKKQIKEPSTNHRLESAKQILLGNQYNY